MQLLKRMMFILYLTCKDAHGDTIKSKTEVMEHYVCNHLIVQEKGKNTETPTVRKKKTLEQSIRSTTMVTFEN